MITIKQTTTRSYNFSFPYVKPRADDEVIGCIHLDHVAAITYCPFCGVKLPEVEG